MISQMWQQLVVLPLCGRDQSTATRRGYGDVVSISALLAVTVFNPLVVLSLRASIEPLISALDLVQLLETLP